MFDSGNEGEIGRVMEEVTVELTAFIEEDVGLIGEMAAGSKSESSTDEVRGREVELLESPDKHRCSGGFAVSACDGNEAEILKLEELGEKFVAFGGFDAELLGSEEFGVVGRKCGSVDEPIDRRVFVSVF